MALQLLDPWAAWAEAEGVVVAWWDMCRASIWFRCFLLFCKDSGYMCSHSRPGCECRRVTECGDRVMVVVGTFRHSLAAGIPILGRPPLRHPTFTAPAVASTTPDEPRKIINAPPIAPSMSIVRLHTTAAWKLPRVPLHISREGPRDTAANCAIILSS